jgi:hypothetical protein
MPVIGADPTRFSLSLMAFLLEEFLSVLDWSLEILKLLILALEKKGRPGKK